jgi:hypothetical protein
MAVRKRGIAAGGLGFPGIGCFPGEGKTPKLGQHSQTREKLMTSRTSLMVFIILIACLSGLAANIPPEVANVTASQRTDGSGLVDIYYDVADTENDSLTIELIISLDNGGSWTIVPNPALLSGDVGQGIMQGAGKHVVWDAGAEQVVYDDNLYRAKVIARDDAFIPSSFVFVAGGTFYNGVSNVTLSSFWIDKYEVTQPSYVAVMGSNPAYFTSVVNGPVERVSWFNAIEYCNRRSIQNRLTPCYTYTGYGSDPADWPAGWNTSNSSHDYINCDWTANGFRLPTDMELMFAAKGGNLSQGYTYSGSNDVNQVAWYANNSGDTTHMVGTKNGNELDLFDISGNVWEWVWDRWGNLPTGAQIDPTGPVTGSDRTFRGGGWYVSAVQCMVTTRYNQSPTYQDFSFGFRVCRRY